MVTNGEKEITVLKLEHEETKLFLQLIWSILASFVVSLAIATFTEKTSISQLKSVSILIIAISMGVTLTLLVFRRKFTEIKNKIRGVKR